MPARMHSVSGRGPAAAAAPARVVTAKVAAASESAIFRFMTEVLVLMPSCLAVQCVYSV